MYIYVYICIYMYIYIYILERNPCITCTACSELPRAAGVEVHNVFKLPRKLWRAFSTELTRPQGAEQSHRAFSNCPESCAETCPGQKSAVSRSTERFRPSCPEPRKLCRELSRAEEHWESSHRAFSSCPDRCAESCPGQKSTGSQATERFRAIRPGLV